ncbi:MAG: metallophosphoesterase family protein [Anaerolineaceae bacterium]|nr:metallophosphoesterase family protein [Anaerolineaceae bacterium]
MRLAVISDIHGNLAALEAVLHDLETIGGAELTWCLGDLAAFGPRPAECVRRVKELAEAGEGKTFKVIGGNTDRYLVNGTRMKTPSATDEETFKKRAAAWTQRDQGLNWTVGQLAFSDYEFLKQIRGRELGQDVQGYGHVIGYHGTPGDDEGFLRPDTPATEALDSLLDREGRLGIGGHIHVQMDRDLGNWRAVNVGSVGFSFDNPGHAQWGLFTFTGDEVMVDLRNVPFDVEAVIADLHTVGYPSVDFVTNWLRGGA